ncbi:MAG TPA: choice-of-anchor P family protein [Marmoricola sp.]
MRPRYISTAAVAGAVLALPMLVGGPSFADDTSTPAPQAYGGFTTDATATPLRIEFYEPAIPIPASPQLEFNFSYSHVEGSSGPASKARVSAMWPGSPVGEGLKTFVTQLGLPEALAANGYPVQANAQSPGDPSSASQQFFPGMVGTAKADDDGAVARTGYGLSGSVAGDDTGSSGNAANNSSGVNGLKNTLKDGDLSSLGALLGGGTQKSSADDGSGSNPLGALSLLVDPGGMSSSSRTSYTADSVTSKATSQLGAVALLGGIVKIDGFTSTSTTTSSLSGATSVQKENFGGLTIAGTPFEFTSDGIEAAGTKTAIPGLSDNPVKALKSLGISIDVATPTKSVKGSVASSALAGPTITIDTQPVLKLLSLDKLPLAGLINKLPDSAGQAKGLLLAALQAHPKIVLKLGAVSSDAQTVAGIDLGGGGGGTPSSSSSPSPAAGNVGDTGSTGDLGSGTPDATAAGATAPVNADITPTSGVPGLPPLGSVPGMLMVGAIALAAGVGWWLRNGVAAVFGGGESCSHGLPSGLPDLRKV